MKYDPAIHHRRSIRLKGYDYTQPGAYFVTLVSYHRDEILGALEKGVMKLSPLGQIVHDEWMRSADIRKEIILFEDEFVVMPNHLHGIVWIVEADGISPAVGADGVRPEITSQSDRGACHAPLPKRPPRSLSSFVAGYKASVTGRAQRELNISEIWQRNFFDRIIRNEKEFQAIWNYIDHNPQKWVEDQLHPSASPNPFNRE